MIRSAFIAVLALALASPVAARPRLQVQRSFIERLLHIQPSVPVRYAGRHGVRQIQRSAGQATVSDRPSECRGIAWCGCWLRLHFGLADKALNRAREWARIGNNAGGPVVGAIAVWPHHVGVITGINETTGNIILLSGNDGHVVRERERSTRGVIAYRVI